jgi:hypothetical protein
MCHGAGPSSAGEQPTISLARVASLLEETWDYRGILRRATFNIAGN